MIGNHSPMLHKGIYKGMKIWIDMYMQIDSLEEMNMIIIILIFVM